jgi:hypothetical protein
MSKPDIKQSEIELRNIDDLSNWEDNPRSILAEDFERLKKQIKRLGMYKPLLVNHDNIVLGGNMRLRALRDLGVTGDVYVTVVEAETPEKMLEYALSDNDAAGITDDLKLAEVYPCTRSTPRCTKSPAPCCARWKVSSIPSTRQRWAGTAARTRTRWIRAWKSTWRQHQADRAVLP